MKLKRRVKAGLVGVYEVTRHYGGPEEGGWWWNARAHITSYRCRKEDRDELCKKLSEEYVNEGNIYSVLGGVEYEFHREFVAGQFRTKRKPHYE